VGREKSDEKEIEIEREKEREGKAEGERRSSACRRRPSGGQV